MLNNNPFHLISYRCNIRLCREQTGYFIRLRRRLAEIAAVGTLAILTGCAGNSDSTGTSDSVGGAPHLVAQKQELNADIAADLLSVLPQILEPFGTTVQFNNPESGDVNPIVTRLVDLGYGIKKVDSDQGNFFLRLEDLSDEDGVLERTTKLRLSVGELEFQRSYRIVKQNVLLENQGDFRWRYGVAVVPASPLSVSGMRAGLKISGSQLAEPDNLNSLSVVPSTIVYSSSTPIKGGIPSIALITDDVVKGVVDSASGGPDYKNLYADSFELGNMKHVEESAFASIADNYNRISREIIVFPNDSDFLGRRGKVLVKKVIDRYSKSSDIVGIIGCSTGSTKLAIGNAGLALGRATRVAEELFSAGIARDKVFNEGCWSEQKNDRGLPNRGVVVDLWRRKS